MLGVKPSFATGFAQWPGMSEYPQLWERLAGAWYATLGASGSKIRDLSGNGCTGTLVGNPNWISSRFGSVLDLDAVGDYVQIAAGNFPNIPANGSITICAWVNLRNNPTNDYHGIFGFGDSGDNPAICFSVGDTGNCMTGFLETDTSGQIQFTKDGTPFAFRGWSFAALVINRNTNQAIRYMNGLQTGTIDSIAAQTGTISHLNNVVLGKLNKIGETAGIYWDGQIACVLVYERVLLASEIALLYQMMRRFAA